MKFRIFIVILLVAVAAIAGRHVNRMGHVGTVEGGGSTRNEIRESYRLKPGARVEVRHINGTVEIKTAETDTAEVHIIRTADNPEDLNSQRVIIEDSPDALTIRNEGGRGGGWWRRLWAGGSGQVRQQLTLTIPRSAEVAVRHINGPVEIGELEGSLEVAHVNGRVEVAGVRGRSEVAHVNGGVKIGVAQLVGQGLEVRGVNGNVEVSLRESMDAEINVEGHNGGFALNVPNVTTQERESRSTFRARLGAGGPEINVRSVNGNLRFESSASAVAVSNVAPAKPEAPDAPDMPPPPLPLPPVK
jgi:DUF4097 and DUF4098 domain-containing protein YvlB